MVLAYMIFIFWKKRQTKHPKANNLLGADNLDEVLRSICPDKEFINVLQQKADGVTTPVDECYLADKLRNDKSVMEYYEFMKEKYPGVDLRPNCIKRRAQKVILLLALILLGMGGLYALFHKQKKHFTSISERGDYAFYHWRISSVLDSAQLLYNKKFILEQDDIKDMSCSGTLDPAMSLEDFLYYFALSNGLEYYSDTENVIHIRKAKINSSIKK